jgi:cytoskeletal protein CcmA (bactofilin family)
MQVAEDGTLVNVLKVSKNGKKIWRRAAEAKIQVRIVAGFVRAGDCAVTDVRHFRFPRQPVWTTVNVSGGRQNAAKRSKLEEQERHVSYFSQAKTGREKGQTGVAAEAAPASAPAPVVKNTGDMVSKFGTGTLITGNIVCDGAAEIYGRVIGDIQAAQVTVGDGAHVEGNITGHEVTICGSFKGTTRAHNVKLKGAAKIDGEVYSKSLTVEENVQFEGVSRRLDKPIELQSSSQAASSAASSLHGGSSTTSNGGARPFAVAGGAAAPFTPATPNSGAFTPTGT